MFLWSKPVFVTNYRKERKPNSCKMITILICVGNKSDLLHHLVLYESLLFICFVVPPPEFNWNVTVCCWANGIEALHHSRLTSISRLTVTPTSRSSILYCGTKYSSPLNQIAALSLGCLAWLFIGWDCQANPENMRRIPWNTRKYFKKYVEGKNCGAN